MTSPTIVPFYAALLTFLYIGLSVRVIQARGKARIGIGAGRDPVLERRIRVHANFAEYVPLGLILLAFVEMQGSSHWLLHILSLGLMIGRALHAYGMLNDKELRFRAAGMLTTFGVLAVAGIALIINGAQTAIGN